MALLKYANLGFAFEFETTLITGVIGDTSLEKVFTDLVKSREVHLPNITIGIISSNTSKTDSISLGDLISKQFKVHKKVSRKRSMQALKEILEFLGSDDFVDIPFSELSELQLGQAWLANAIALRPNTVISWNFLSSLSAPVHSRISKSIVNIQQNLGVGFLLLEKRQIVVEKLTQTFVNFHPEKVKLERPNISIAPSVQAITKSSPDEISGLDFVSS